jgi:hypothetical protein
MLLLFPAALVGLLALAAPIAIHILAKRRAERIPFPTLRFLPPGRLASVRRHVLEDAGLLAVRLSILAAAAVALAGPLLVTKQREAGWNAQTQTAVVEGADLRQGLRRALAALDAAPPGRREIVVRSTFPIGSISAADVAAVPAPVGVRFERTAAIPPMATVDLAPALTDRGTRRRTVTLDRGMTTIREDDSAGNRPPAADADAARRAVLSQGVLAPADGRLVRVLSTDMPDAAGIAASAVPIHDAWMADALAAIERHDDLRAASKQMASGLPDARFASSPWTPVARAADSGPLAVGAAASGALVLITAAPRDSFVSALLLRTAMNAIGDRRLPGAETMAIPDAQVNAWTRAPGPAPAPRFDTLDRDDRRWLWIAALALLALEWRIRRSRAEAHSMTSERRREPEEHPRVA